MSPRAGYKLRARFLANRLLSIVSSERIPDARAWVAQQRSLSPASLQRGWLAPKVIEQRPSELLVRKPPITLEDRIHANFVNHYVAESPSCGVFILHGARILGAEGYVLSPTGAVFEEFTYDRRAPAHDYDLYYRLRVPAQKHVAGWWATIAYPDSTELFHFELESLPRVEQLESFRPLLDGLIVPERLRPDHFKALAELGWSRDRLLLLGPNSHLSFDNLIVPSYLAGKNTPGWAREVFSRLPRGDGASFAKRVYISRDDARLRHVVNETDVVDTLKKYGFQKYVLADLSAEDQRALFSQAEIVVAPHGAALSKLVHSPAGMKLVEMFSPHHVDTTYWTLSEAFGIAYAYTVGKPRPRVQAKVDFEDIEVDLDKLESTVRLMLNEAPMGGKP